jgi:hypothetical protein
MSEARERRRRPQAITIIICGENRIAIAAPNGVPIMVGATQPFPAVSSRTDVANQ